MPPKINLTVQQKTFVNVANKYAKDKGLNVRDVLPLLFQVQFNISICYSTLSKFLNEHDIENKQKNEIISKSNIQFFRIKILKFILLVEQILMNQNQVILESNIHPSETHVLNNFDMEQEMNTEICSLNKVDNSDKNIRKSNSIRSNRDSIISKDTSINSSDISYGLLVLLKHLFIQY